MPFNPIDIKYNTKILQSDEKRGNYESSLDLNEYCIPHPSSTFFVKAEGTGMEDASIFSGDLLLVDRGAEPANGRLVLAVIAGDFAIRRLLIRNRVAYLASESSASPPLEITSDTSYSIWGVIIGVIHKF